ncbi:hypothetical protein [Methylococcus capsulatus]|uniref:hypothetical protein n=1 Tax=Methylococcus capsulatus TaxID=414 RepID=UPI001C52EAB1|nr:hypothetical protein [Methylococcus capsulatus]QXP90930.1 hypothetical protein KW114_01835 [Methylococcus capsulatus]
MKPYNSAIAIMAFTASLQFSPAAQADASYLYMIPSIMGMGTSIYQQHQAMAIQEEAQRRQMESLRVQQNCQQTVSAPEMTELKKLLQDQQQELMLLRQQLESRTR